MTDGAMLACTRVRLPEQRGRGWPAQQHCGHEVRSNRNRHVTEGAF